jgi:hypothetical protein
MARMVFAGTIGLAVSLAIGAPLGAQSSTAQQPPPTTTPVPKPFPNAINTTPKPADPNAKPIDPQLPTSVNIPGNPPVYPAAEFLREFDAGRNQKYYLFGTNAPFAEIVEYYKGTLKNGGRELSRAPGMQQFDLGRFDADTMAYPPSVVVQDHTWNGSEGYLFVRGTAAKRYRTIIQIVPAR